MKNPTSKSSDFVITPRGRVASREVLSNIPSDKISNGDYFFCDEDEKLYFAHKEKGAEVIKWEVVAKKTWIKLERQMFGSRAKPYPKIGYDSGVLYHMSHTDNLDFRLIGWAEGRKGLANAEKGLAQGVIRDSTPDDPHCGRTYALWMNHIDFRFHVGDCLSDQTRRKNGKGKTGILFVYTGNGWKAISSAQQKRERLYHYPPVPKTPEEIKKEREDRKARLLFKKTGFKFQTRYSEWWKLMRGGKLRDELQKLVKSCRDEKRNTVSFGGLWDVYDSKRKDYRGRSILVVYGGFNGRPMKNKASKYMSVVLNVIRKMEAKFGHVWLVSYKANCSDCHTFEIAFEPSTRISKK